MCSACGFPAAPGHWTEAGAADMTERLRARFRRADVLRRVLRVYGLNAHDGGLVPGVQISDNSGSHVIARDLADVWAIAEKLGGRVVDPLDPAFTSAPGGERPLG